MPDSLKRKRRQKSFPGIRDGNRDVITCLSGRSTANEAGNTKSICDCCFRRQEPWVHRRTPVFSRKDILLGSSMPFVFFVSRVLLGQQGYAFFCTAGGVCVLFSFVGFGVFGRLGVNKKGADLYDRRPYDGRWRKGRDLNPRYRFKPVYSLSRRAPSADSDTFPR